MLTKNLFCLWVRVIIFCLNIEGKSEEKIKRSVCICKGVFMLKYYTLRQHYVRFLIVSIMLIFMSVYLTQAYTVD